VREVHSLELVVELDENIDDCFDVVDALEVLAFDLHGLIVVHYSECRLEYRS
jgi:hypothetical protein